MTANHYDNLRKLVGIYHDVHPATAAICKEAAERIRDLEQFIANLGIRTMHPDMGGNHQCSIDANGKRLNAEEWALVRSAEKNCEQAQ